MGDYGEVISWEREFIPLRSFAFSAVKYLMNRKDRRVRKEKTQRLEILSSGIPFFFHI